MYAYQLYFVAAFGDRAFLQRVECLCYGASVWVKRHFVHFECMEVVFVVALKRATVCKVGARAFGCKCLPFFFVRVVDDGIQTEGSADGCRCPKC